MLSLTCLVGAAPVASTADQLTKAVTRLIAMNPGLAIDFSKESGEVCMNAGFANGGHMSHYAINPESTSEDIIDMVDATPFVKAGLDLSKMEKLPARGKMKPFVWYYLPANEPEPHHGGKKFSTPLLIRASNVL